MGLEVFYLKVDELTPYSKNTRKHAKKDVRNIKKSIADYGMNDPIGIWSDKNIIVEGHGRFEACKQLGMTEVPCIRLDHLTDKQRREYAIAHNATAELSEWDFDILAEEILDLDLDDFDFGFDFGVEYEAEAVEDDYDGSVPDKAISKLGDVWQLGRHRLMCGDSTVLTDVEKLMDGQLADMLLTDPPYNVAYEGKTKDKLTIENDSMDNDSFRQFLVDAFTNADAVMKAGAVFYIWHADSEGYNFRGACFDIGWKDGASHLWASDRKQTTIIEWDRPTKADIHPTMKPIGLFDYQMKNNTKGDDIVLDLFNGSGTTIMACEQNGRIARCMELDPRYVDATIKRWEDFTGEKAVLL